MTEILWHGRGGQGAFTAAKILGAAYSLEEGKNNFSLAFPSFGPERRGAPILAFTKLDSKQIGDRSQIKKADFVIFLDDTLFSESAFNEIKEGGKIIINTKKTEEKIKAEFTKKFENGTFSASTTADFADFSVFQKNLILFDGDSIAQKILGLPVANTALLTVLAKKSGIVSQNQLVQAIKLYMNSKLAAKNIPLVEEIFKNGSEK